MLPEEIDSVWIWLKALKKGEIIRKKKLLIKKEVNTHLNSPQRQAPLQEEEEEEEVGGKKKWIFIFFRKNGNGGRKRIPSSTSTSLLRMWIQIEYNLRHLITLLTR